MGLEQLVQLMAVIRLKALAPIGAAAAHAAVMANTARLIVFDNFMRFSLLVLALIWLHTNAKCE